MCSKLWFRFLVLLYTVDLLYSPETDCAYILFLRDSKEKGGRFSQYNPTEITRISITFHRKLSITAGDLTGNLTCSAEHISS